MNLSISFWEMIGIISAFFLFKFVLNIALGVINRIVFNKQLGRAEKIVGGISTMLQTNDNTQQFNPNIIVKKQAESKDEKNYFG